MEAPIALVPDEHQLNPSKSCLLTVLSGNGSPGKSSVLRLSAEGSFPAHSRELYVFYFIRHCRLVDRPVLVDPGGITAVLQPEVGVITLDGDGHPTWGDLIRICCDNTHHFISSSCSSSPSTLHSRWL